MPSTATQQPDQFHESDRVIHNKFGVGTVIDDRAAEISHPIDRYGDKNILGSLRPHEEAPVAANDNWPPISATPFALRDPSSLPQRDWLFGQHFIGRYATASVGPGVGGKTAHSITEALAMVTGRPLLDPDGPRTKPLRAWWINAEDPQDEIDRRFHAAAKHFGVTAEQIGGRLFTDSGREQEFVIARTEGRDLKIVEPFIEELVAKIKRREIDVVIIDPFVSTHEAQENDNSAMQRVAAAWLRVWPTMATAASSLSTTSPKPRRGNCGQCQRRRGVQG